MIGNAFTRGHGGSHGTASRNDLNDQWVFPSRHPERSDDYWLLESGIEALPGTGRGLRVALWFLRKEVQGAVFAFLECGIPENGVARALLGVWSDFFVVFSYRIGVKAATRAGMSRRFSACNRQAFVSHKRCKLVYVRWRKR